MNMYANEKIEGKAVVRISKTKARNLFCKDYDIWVIPSNLRLDNIWFKPMHLRKSKEVIDAEKEFEVLINSIHYYNCCNEMGKYLRYYMLDPEEMQIEVNTPVCPFCKKAHKVKVVAKDYELYMSKNRPYIQDIFPYLRAIEREMLMTGTCEDCWNKYFKCDEAFDGEETDDEDFDS